MITYTYPNNGKMYVGYNITTEGAVSYCLVGFEFSKDGQVWFPCTPVPGDGLYTASPVSSGQNAIFVWDLADDKTFYGHLRFKWAIGNSCPSSNPINISDVRDKVFVTHTDTWEFGPNSEFSSFSEAYERMSDFNHSVALTATQIFIGESGVTYTDQLDLDTVNFPINVGSFGVTIGGANRISFSGATTIPTISEFSKDVLPVWSGPFFANAPPDVFEDGALLENVGSHNLCLQTPGSIFWSANVLYIHASDSSRVRINKKIYTTPGQRYFIKTALAFKNFSILDVDFFDYLEQPIQFTGTSGTNIYNGFSCQNCRFITTNGAVLVDSTDDGVTITGNSYIQKGATAAYGWRFTNVGLNFIFKNNYHKSDLNNSTFLEILPRSNAFIDIRQNIFLGGYVHVEVDGNGSGSVSNTVTIYNNIFRSELDPNVGAPIAIVTQVKDTIIIGNAFLDIGTGETPVVAVDTQNSGSLVMQNNTIIWDYENSTPPSSIIFISQASTKLFLFGNLFRNKNGTIWDVSSIASGSSIYGNVYLTDDPLITPSAHTLADMHGLGFDLQGRTDDAVNPFQTEYKWDSPLGGVDLIPYTAIAKSVYGIVAAPTLQALFVERNIGGGYWMGMNDGGLTPQLANGVCVYCPGSAPGYTMTLKIIADGLGVNNQSPFEASFNYIRKSDDGHVYDMANSGGGQAAIPFDYDHSHPGPFSVYMYQPLNFAFNNQTNTYERRKEGTYQIIDNFDGGSPTIRETRIIQKNCVECFYFGVEVPLSTPCPIPGQVEATHSDQYVTRSQIEPGRLWSYTGVEEGSFHGNGFAATPTEISHSKVITGTPAPSIILTLTAHAQCFDNPSAQCDARREYGATTFADFNVDGIVFSDGSFTMWVRHKFNEA